MGYVTDPTSTPHVTKQTLARTCLCQHENSLSLALFYLTSLRIKQSNAGPSIAWWGPTRPALVRIPFSTYDAMVIIANHTHR
jgi:hypothetical protein